MGVASSARVTWAVGPAGEDDGPPKTLILGSHLFADSQHKHCRAHLVKGSRYAVMDRGGELGGDELVQPLGVWLDPAGLLTFFPGGKVVRFAHYDYSDAVAASDAAGLFDGRLD